MPLINEVELKDIFSGASSQNDFPATDDRYQEQLERVTSVLKTPYDERLDYDDGNAWATSYRELFNQTSAQFFSQYEKHEVLPEDFDLEKAFTVFNSTNLVYFPCVVTNRNENGETVDSIQIKFHKLSGEESSTTDDDTADLRVTWLRPMVTVSEIDLEVLGMERIPEPVDEALLIRGGTQETGFYKRWGKAGSISIDEPRDNAWADRWITHTWRWLTE